MQFFRAFGLSLLKSPAVSLMREVITIRHFAATKPCQHKIRQNKFPERVHCVTKIFNGFTMQNTLTCVEQFEYLMQNIFLVYT